MLIILKLKPITILSSGIIEQKLFSKEKRFLIKFLKIILEIFFTIITLLAFTVTLFSSKNLYNNILVIVWVIIFLVYLFTILWLVEIKKMNFFDVFKKRSSSNILLYVLLSLFFLSLYLLPSYFVGTTFYAEIVSQALSFSERLGVLLGLSVIYLVTCTVLIPISHIATKFLNFRDLNPINKAVFIKLGDEKWFLSHQVGQKTYYLMDDPNPDKSSKFKFMKEEELLTQILQVENYENV
ncbi:hypothetical protein [Paenibacillus pinihumi]|uniref:hypothetical protein n=1 Tax=Paenibacillus pinihumi TaxID=669462 RepID=UPI0003FCA25E|nr:hypothetical protein [Paenibacillus pinihumi]